MLENLIGFVTRHYVGCLFFLYNFHADLGDHMIIYFRVFTVHGSADEIIPVEDALEIAKLIPSHKLHIIEGANHCYTEHQEELAKTVVDFLTSIQVLSPCKR